VVPIDDIVALKKLGLSTVKRTALNWALDSEGAGGTGLEVKVIRRPTDLDQVEETLELTSIVRRDELFNRLIALGYQRWQML
jgi:autonomous glycyl radical cofactor GrcA